MKILAFAASNNSHSINRILANYAASSISTAEVDMLDIHDYEMPIFSDEREKQLGQPKEARRFYQKIADADAVIISFAEHNGTYTAAYKNLFDWASRINSKVFQNKPMLLLATSPGPGGASSVLATAVKSAPYFAGDVVASLSVPSFNDNFDLKRNQIINNDIKTELSNAVKLLTNKIKTKNKHQQYSSYRRAL